MDAGGAGVDDGLIPKVNPPPCPVAAAAAAAAAAAVEVGWARLEGALVPKLKPPPVVLVLVVVVEAAADVTWTLVAPKLNPPNERPLGAVEAAGAAVATGWV